MTDKINIQTIIDLQTLYKANRMSEFYYSRSIGDIQLTADLKKKICVAYLKSGGPEKYPKQFYFIDHHGNIEIYHNMYEIILGNIVFTGVVTVSDIGDDFDGK